MQRSTPQGWLGFLRLHAVSLMVLLMLILMWVVGGWTDPRWTSVRWVIAALVLASVFLSIRNYVRLSQGLQHITDAASQVAADANQRPYVSAEGDLRPLAAAMNQMFGGINDRQHRLLELADRLSTVLSAMVEGVLAVDDRQRVLFANAAAGRLLGFDARAAEGKPLLEVARNHMLHEAVSETLALRNPGQNETQRYEFDSHQAQGQILSFHATRLQGDPCPGVVLVLQDVTELRRLETLRQEFVANVSHELKTPLTAIKAYAETLQNGAIDQPEVNRDFTGKIESEADRLDELIADMLQLAKIESGHVPMEMTSVDLAAAIRKCVQRHEAEANRQQVALNCENCDQEVSVNADNGGLRTILDNLVDNALRHTEPGGEVTISWLTTNNGHVGLLVSDSGIGIPFEHQSRVFERFFRIDQARTRDIGNTGLGLAIVKHLTQSFGGSVVVCSQPEQGTTFRVLLRSSQVAAAA